jgi:hypothetical protein
MRRTRLLLIPALLAVVMLAISGCSGGRELSAEEKAGNQNFMGNDPSKAPMSGSGTSGPAGTTPSPSASNNP